MLRQIPRIAGTFMLCLLPPLCWASGSLRLVPISDALTMGGDEWAQLALPYKGSYSGAVYSASSEGTDRFVSFHPESGMAAIYTWDSLAEDLRPWIDLDDGTMRWFSFAHCFETKEAVFIFSEVDSAKRHLVLISDGLVASRTTFELKGPDIPDELSTLVPMSSIGHDATGGVIFAPANTMSMTSPSGDASHYLLVLSPDGELLSHHKSDGPPYYWKGEWWLTRSNALVALFPIGGGAFEERKVSSGDPAIPEDYRVVPGEDRVYLFGRGSVTPVKADAEDDSGDGSGYRFSGRLPMIVHDREQSHGVPLEFAGVYMRNEMFAELESTGEVPPPPLEMAHFSPHEQTGIIRIGGDRYRVGLSDADGQTPIVAPHVEKFNLGQVEFFGALVVDWIPGMTLNEE